MRQWKLQASSERAASVWETRLGLMSVLFGWAVMSNQSCARWGLFWLKAYKAQRFNNVNGNCESSFRTLAVGKCFLFFIQGFSLCPRAPSNLQSPDLSFLDTQVPEYFLRKQPERAEQIQFHWGWHPRPSLQDARILKDSRIFFFKFVNMYLLFFFIDVFSLFPGHVMY